MTDIFNFSGREHRQLEITSIAKQAFDLFDDASLKAFETLKNQLQDNRNNSIELNKKLSNYVEDNDGIPTHADIELLEEKFDLASEEYMANEHLNALSEMKIVYLFKSVEITMKSLIHTAYPKINTKDFFQWDSMCSYFKSINIKLSDFNGYVEVTELRKVNNSIKHNSIINEDIKKIREFTGDIQFTYINIDNFHSRIKSKIQNFTKLLGKAIINDLYVFDESRVKKISNDFKLRMEDEVLKKLATKLTDGHKP